MWMWMWILLLKLRMRDVLTSKGGGKNRVFPLEKLRFFDLIISG